jgi:hypothetical protein
MQETPINAKKESALDTQALTQYFHDHVPEIDIRGPLMIKKFQGGIPT